MSADIDADAGRLEEQCVVDQATIMDLEATGIAQRDRIADLELAADLYRAVIAHVEAEGIVARAKIANLEVALVTSRCIGAAIGIIMAGRRITQEQAFDVLRQASQTSNRKLRDVAESVVLTGVIE